MKLIRTFLVIISIFICARSSQAQPSTIQQFQNNQLNTQQQMPLPGLRAGTNAPEIYPGENADIGPQRILRLNPRPNYFDVMVDSEVYYSDNANYSQGSSTNQLRFPSFVYVNTLQMALAPPPFDLGPGKFAPTLGYASQWYNYDSIYMSTLDFNAQTLFAGAKYSIGKWSATANLNFTTLRDQENYDTTYQELLPSLAVQRFIVFNDTMLLAVGDQLDYHSTYAPSIIPNRPTNLNNRFDDAVFLTFNWQVTPHLAIQPFYRFQYSYYPRNSVNTANRNDLLNATGIVFIYSFNEHVSVRAFMNYNHMRSDDPASLSYEEINGGIGGTLDIKF